MKYEYKQLNFVGAILYIYRFLSSIRLVYKRNKIQVTVFRGMQQDRRVSPGKADFLMSQFFRVAGTDELCTRLWFSELICLEVQFFIYIQEWFRFQMISSLSYKPGCPIIDMNWEM